MRKRLMASTAAIIIVGFLVAFALAANWFRININWNLRGDWIPYWR